MIEPVSLSIAAFVSSMFSTGIALLTLNQMRQEAKIREESQARAEAVKVNQAASRLFTSFEISRGDAQALASEYAGLSEAVLKRCADMQSFLQWFTDEREKLVQLHKDSAAALLQPHPDAQCSSVIAAEIADFEQALARWQLYFNEQKVFVRNITASLNAMESMSGDMSTKRSEPLGDNVVSIKNASKSAQKRAN